MCVYMPCYELWEDLNTLNYTVLETYTRMGFRMSFTDILKQGFNLVESIMVCWINCEADQVKI